MKCAILTPATRVLWGQADTNKGDCDYEVMSLIPQHLNQEELNDLTSDLNLSKEASESLACRLNGKKYKYILEQGMKITFYHTREKDLLFFIP